MSHLFAKIFIVITSIFIVTAVQADHKMKRHESIYELEDEYRDTGNKKENRLKIEINEGVLIPDRIELMEDIEYYIVVSNRDHKKSCLVNQQFFESVFISRIFSKGSDIKVTHVDSICVKATSTVVIHLMPIYQGEYTLSMKQETADRTSDAHISVAPFKSNAD